MSKWSAFRYRAGQVRYHLTARDSDVLIPSEFQAMLCGAVAERFRDLPPGDKQHLVTVATMLRDDGGSADLVTAGLIHDVGKSIPGVKVRVPDRVAKVVLDKLNPGKVASLDNQATPPRFGRGLWVLCRHAQAGAELARVSGYSDRVVWLVANHEHAEIDEPVLSALIAADNSGFASAAG